MKEALPIGWKQKCAHKLILKVPQTITFPKMLIEKGSLLAIGLPLGVEQSHLVVFRTAEGHYALGATVSKDQLPLWDFNSPWILLPLVGLDVTGVVEHIVPPQRHKYQTTRSAH